MKPVIIYIHGFRSDKGSFKIQKIQELLPDYEILAENFSANPQTVLEQLNDICSKVEKQNNKHFMGSSLGGFYAMYMATKLDCKSFCINPSLRSHSTLQDQVGTFQTFNLGLHYHFKLEYLDLLETMHQELFEILKKGENKYRPQVIFNEDDKVIPHTLFDEFKPYFDLKYYPSGGHQATNIQEIVEGFEIAEWEM